VTLYHQKYEESVLWTWEGRESCPIPLSRAELSPHLEGRLDLQGLWGIAPIHSSSWNNEIHFLSHHPLQMKIWGAQSWNAFHSHCLQKMSLPLPSFCFGFVGKSFALWFLFSLSSCESIYLKVSIDSYWVRITSICSLWTRACSSNCLATSLEVPTM